MRRLLPLFMLLAACGGNSNEPSEPVFHGSGSDPVGDAITTGDMVRASARVEDDTVYLSASFVLAEFTGEDLVVEFYIDIDESGTTGDLSFDPALGSDYVIGYYKDFPDIGISHWENGWVPDFVLTDGSESQDSTMSARIPLALLGGDEGKLRFKARVAWWNGLNYDISDQLTAVGSPAVVVH